VDLCQFRNVEGFYYPGFDQVDGNPSTVFWAFLLKRPSRKGSKKKRKGSAEMVLAAQDKLALATCLPLHTCLDRCFLPRMNDGGLRANEFYEAHLRT